MPYQHGRNGVLVVWDSSAASRNISGDITDVSYSGKRNNPEVTGLGDDSIQRIAGLRDVTLQANCIYNTDAGSGVYDVLDDLMSGSAITLVKYYPVGTITGCAFLTGCMLISSLGVKGPVNAPVGLSFEMQLASGSMSGSTV